MKIRTLLVDDSPETLETLSLMYASHPQFEVVGTVHTVSEAVGFLKEKAVELVSIDIQLRFGSGFQLCAHVHEHYPEVFITMCSVEGRDLYQTLAYQNGAHHFLTKPITRRDIDDLVMRYTDFRHRFHESETQRSHDEVWIGQILADLLHQRDG
jgi:DNA-binding NarL/FixJ family response regulator